MKPPLTIHGKNALILGVMLLGMIPFGWNAFGSTALGGGIQIVNLRGLERGVAAMLGLAADGQTLASRVLVSLRWVLVLGLVAFCLFVLPLEPVAFVVGLSSVVPAVIWHGLVTSVPEPRGGE